MSNTRARQFLVKKGIPINAKNLQKDGHGPIHQIKKAYDPQIYAVKLDLQFFAERTSESIFSNKATKHIFHGNINGKGNPSGYHHSNIISDATLSNVSDPDNFGVYKATIEMNGKKKFSTFFPKNWNRVDVMDAIKDARNSVDFDGAGWYTGKTETRMKVKMWLNNRGHVDTAFPIYTNRNMR
ncbi:EndoU domain-containing protein [Bacillus sp. WMMC1349]|nr:EndoU domain-containing protein [Bacillus sp. WMMC1349]NPC91278.1 EndoU domain-containing protein [Bacillus sp. WMMC1349]